MKKVTKPVMEPTIFKTKKKNLDIFLINNV